MNVMIEKSLEKFNLSGQKFDVYIRWKGTVDFKKSNIFSRFFQIFLRTWLVLQSFFYVT